MVCGKSCYRSNCLKHLQRYKQSDLQNVFGVNVSWNQMSTHYYGWEYAISKQFCIYILSIKLHKNKPILNIESYCLVKMKLSNITK